MSSSPNSFFTNEELSPHEQYIMFIGYMERVFDEMRSQSNTDVEKQITELIMVILNKKVVEMLFPDFGRDPKTNIAFQEISHIAKSRYKLHIGERIREILDDIKRVVNKHSQDDLGNPETSEKILKELFDA